MIVPREIIIDLVSKLPDEKLGTVLAFINFVKQQDDPILVLEPNDEKEIIQILKANEWYCDDQIKQMVDDMKR